MTTEAGHSALDPDSSFSAQPDYNLSSHGEPYGEQRHHFAADRIQNHAQQTAAMPRVAAMHAVRSDNTAQQADAAGRRSRLNVWLLGGLAFLLALTLGIGALYTRQEITQRDATIQAQSGKINDLTKANSDFQAQVNQLTGQRDSLVTERDGLVSVRNQLESDRNALTQQRDDLSKSLASVQSERDTIATERDGLKTQVANLQTSVSDKDRQISQAQSDASRQQSRAQSAEAAGVILAQVVTVDDKIHDQFGILLGYITDMQNAINYRDTVAYNTANAHANQTMSTLGDLFNQRKALLDKLQ